MNNSIVNLRNHCVTPMESVNFTSKRASICDEKRTSNQIISLSGARALRSMALANLSFKGTNFEPGLFKEVAAFQYNNPQKNDENTNWKFYTQRKIYEELHPYRSPFDIDTNRILNSEAFSRLSRKKQVYMKPVNDHTTTRGLHVVLVENVSRDIAKRLGLNADLTRAIALGHDIGHAPFGHEGERAIKKIMTQNGINESFWHERNGLKFVDEIETWIDKDGIKKNLNLTYAVRDGIISHCGEINENHLFPRKDFFDLMETVKEPNQYPPGSWEGCVVKVSDKIAYLGRDIEDAFRNGFLEPEKKKELTEIVAKCLDKKPEEVNVNNISIVDGFIDDLCENSSPEKGIGFSKKYSDLMKAIKDFNLHNIYLASDGYQEEYSFSALNTIFNKLNSCYDPQNPSKGNTLRAINKMSKKHSALANSFKEWLKDHSDLQKRRDDKSQNKLIYSIEKEEDYKKAIIDFISSMTDHTAIKSYEDIMYARY